MHDRPRQDLSERFAGIIKMILVAIRAQGWRSLMNLPKLVLVTLLLNRYRTDFAALVAAFRAGRLGAPAPAEPQAVCAALPVAPPVAAPDRQQPAERRSRPAADGGAERAPKVKTAGCAAPSRPASVTRVARARAQAAEPPWPRRRTPDPLGVPGLRAGIIASGRSR